MERVLIEIKDHVAVVRFNRPTKMNALDVEQFKAIIEAGETLNADSTVRAVVLSGEGSAFCAGLDVSVMGGDNEMMNTPLVPRSHGITNIWQQAVWTWHEMQVPVIAAVHGVALGGGLQLMLAADIKYVHPDTKLSILEMKWGIIPDMAGTQLMYHNVRQDIIKELTFTNRMFSGQEAVDYGFATHVSNEPLAAALALAKVIASKSPSAIVKAKKLLNNAPYLSAAKGLLQESKEQAEILKKSNQLEAVKAALTKQPGNFEDHRD